MEQVSRQDLVIGGEVNNIIMRHIIVHRNRELVINQPLPDNVGVFFNEITHTAKVFSSEKEASEFETLLTKRDEEGEVQQGEVIPIDFEGLKKFADEKNIPYSEADTAESLKDIVDTWIDKSNYPVMWEAGQTLMAGDVIQIDGTWYQVIQSHTSQIDWHPKTTPALFVETSPPGDIPEWKQPTGAHDAYNTGDKVRFEGEIYESLIDANVWSPAVYPQGWKKL